MADKRGYRARLAPENARATQLYRTLPHKFGHYVQYRRFVETPPPELAGMDKDALVNYFWLSVPHEEKEKFAHAYVDRLREDLLARGVIPFSSAKPAPVETPPAGK